MGRHRARADDLGTHKGLGSGSPRGPWTRTQAWASSAGLRFGGSRSHPPADFPLSQYNTRAHTLTHSLTLRQHSFWPRLPPGRQKYVGGGDGRWRPGCGRRGCHPPAPGRPPGPGLHVSVRPAGGRKASAQSWKTGEGCSRGPLRAASVSAEARAAPASGLGNPSLALRWLPAAADPATAGETRVWGRGRGEGLGAHRTAGAGGSSARSPRTLQLELARPRPALPSRPAELPPPPARALHRSDSAGAGVSACREGGARGLGPQRPAERTLEDRASTSGARNRGPNEMQARFIPPTRHTLGKCKRHWHIQGKQAEFLLATK